MGIEPFTDIAAAINAKASAYGLPFHCDSELVFNRPELNALRDVWRGGAATVVLPGRSDFDGQALKSALKHLAIMERVTGTNWTTRYRVEFAGSYIAAVLGDQTGRFIDEWVPAALLPRWIALFDAVLEGGIPLRIATEFEYAGLDYAAGEMFIAPLSDDAGMPNLVIICLYIKPRERTAAGNDETSADGETPALEESPVSVSNCSS
jgi:hypothetical protein